MRKSQKLFSSSQEILYLVCAAAWNLCSQFLSEFTAFRAVYTPEYITAALQAVQDAQSLPSSQQRSGGRTLARIAAVNAMAAVQADWQNLKTYITNAFDKDQVKTKVMIAGGSFYSKVSAGNWGAAHSLIDAANAFIADNLDVLTADGNMPAGFQATFQAHGLEFIEASAAYANATVEKKQFAGEKSEANNDIYQQVMTMLKDGQQIFADNKVAREQFVFERLKAIYKGGSASLIGYITNANNLGIEGATIISADGVYKATTNKKGYYKISRIAEGTYTFTISCPGYAPLDQSITFTAGVKSKADATLINTMKKAA